MDVNDSTVEDVALVGLAVRTVLTLVPQQAQMIVRLDSAGRREAATAHLDYLVSRSVLSTSQAKAFRMRISGGTPTNASAPDAGRTAPRPVTISDILTAALDSDDKTLTDSILDTLWDAAVTIVGIIAGESIGGPAGALLGGMAAHEWAVANPPSTWFR